MMHSPVALIVEQRAPRRAEIAGVLSLAGYDPKFVSLGSAPEQCLRQAPQLVLFVIGAADPGADLACLARLRATLCGARFLVVAAVSSEALAIAALHAGAQGYVKEPWTAAMLSHAVGELLLPDCAPGQGACALRRGERLIGQGPNAQQLRTQLARIAPTESSVLITGETGTGKDVVAELIHHNSKRAGKPFICLNTAALPDSLIENELFGHERGAYTGALSEQEGKLSAANGGTLFLDEIGDVSLAVQTKLLRAIENKVAYRVGGNRSVHFDVRIIAATNHDLEQEAREGRFRSDLYYRLNVIRMRLAPLRERPEDIPLLINHYLREFKREMGRTVRGLSPRAVETFCSYHWPGNVRELRNAIEALLANLAPETTGIVDIPPEVMRQLAFAVGAPATERERLLQALAATSWNKSRAATELHWSRMTLYRKMREHKVELQRQEA
jgi:DNA-binding NtrC family response regulator